MEKVRLTRGEKILLALYEISGDSKRSIRYEDIVVKVFANYPEDFGLKGYPQFPDSGDLVHKPLYDFKKKGLVAAGAKMFALTEKGVVAAEDLKNGIAGAKVENTVRFGRDIEKEISRISKTSGFHLYATGKADKLVDTDFFDLIGATVRTPRNQFIGRLNTLKDVIASVSKRTEPMYRTLAEYYDFMANKFGSIITYKSEH